MLWLTFKQKYCIIYMFCDNGEAYAILFVVKSSLLRFCVYVKTLFTYTRQLKLKHCAGDIGDIGYTGKSGLPGKRRIVTKREANQGCRGPKGLYTVSQLK